MTHLSMCSMKYLIILYDNSDAIRSRYGLTSEEIWELVEQISNVKVGQHYSSYAMAKIMELDYGVGFV